MGQPAQPFSGLELSARAARAADERAIREWGIPSFALMESAGRACADQAQIFLGGAASKAEALVLCGPGNNGGDGLVIARTLVNRGFCARIVVVGGVALLERAGDDVRHNLQLWRDLGHDLDELCSETDFGRFEEVLGNAGVVVDALFGTGLARPLGGDFARCVQVAENSGRPILAVDLPSGLHADTGEVLGIAVKAEVTVTFVAPKLGFRRGAGPAHIGRVVVAEIGIPMSIAEQAALDFPNPGLG